MRMFTDQRGFGFIRHGLIQANTKGYFDKDGVHLSQLGMDLSLLVMKEALEIAGSRWRNSQYW